MHSTCLLDLKDSHNVFWWETANVNKKTPQGTFHFSKKTPQKQYCITTFQHQNQYIIKILYTDGCSSPQLIKDNLFDCPVYNEWCSHKPSVTACYPAVSVQSKDSGCANFSHKMICQSWYSWLPVVSTMFTFIPYFIYECNSFDLREDPTTGSTVAKHSL